MVWEGHRHRPPGYTMDLLVEMSNPGEWMVHCHIADTSHTGMHFHFTGGGAVGGAAAQIEPGVWPMRPG